MRVLLVIPVLLLGCTPTIEGVDRRGRDVTDSALSILDSLPTTTRTVYETRIKTQTLTKVVPRVEVQKELVYIEAERREIGPVMAMVRPTSPAVPDTVYIERVRENRILTTSSKPEKKRWSLFSRVDTVYLRDTVWLSR